MAHLRPFRSEIAAIAIVALSFLIPFITDSPFAYSTHNLIAVAVTAAFSVYIMLRMDLLTFAVPAFMAVGGYAAAIASLKGGIVDSFALTALSFIAPAIVALPLGILVLRLRGIYFVLVTFLLTQILQLLIFETPGLTGGTNGLVGMPATVVFGIELVDNKSVLLLAIGVALAAAIITAIVSGYLRREFAAIEENEVLAQSLGLVVWRYKVIGFVVAAGLAGMAGFSLVNMLLTAHPTSFSPQSSVNYIAYTIIGGRGSMLGPLVGGTLLVWMSSIFSTHGEFSEGLYGLLIMVVVLAARGGIVGTASSLFRWIAGKARGEPDAAPIAGTVKEAAHERG